MAKLSMHENLPFDEATTPPRVSTGDLPMHAEIRRLVTEAYERYRAHVPRWIPRRSPWAEPVSASSG